MTKKCVSCDWFLPLLVFIGLILWGAVWLKAAQWEVGKSYHGFKLLKQKQIKEMGAVGLLFEHGKSGAHLFKIITADDNNTFCISFKTIPQSDCGTPHILEHSVLNGSRHYPVKSPFDILKQGSLHTFLNAITSKDATMYPAASRNDKDFFNLMGIYLDAVFFPRIYDEPKILQREGWHYELDSKDDELKINGIVYNEGQGMYSSPGTELYYRIFKHLFPDNGYGYAAGGYPHAIPSLTLARFLEFHKTFYHPSNSFIFLHGDGNLMKELEFIDKNYLSKFDKVKVTASHIPLQKPFKKMKEITAEYDISARSSEKDNTWLSLNFAAGRSIRRDLTLALQVLSEVLANRPASPLRRALLDAGIGKRIRGLSAEYKQNFFGLMVIKANESDKEKFKKIVFDTLKKLVTKGLDKKMVEGAVNRLEFRLREGAYPWSRYPRAVTDCLLARTGWMFAGDPFLALEYEKPLKTLKQGLKTDYFEKIIEKYLLNNNHCLLLVLKPKKGLGEEKKKQLKEKLAKYKASLSDSQLDKLVKQTKTLKKYQETPDSPEDLKKIPMLSLKDVNPKAEKLEVQVREIAGVKVLAYPIFTGNIIYTRLLFDTSAVPRELIPYVSLLTEVLGRLAAKNYSYGDLDTALNIHTGGVDFDTDLFLENYDSRKPLPKFEVAGKVLPEKVGKLMELQGEIIKHTNFNDPERLREIIFELNARLQLATRSQGFSLARTRLGSYLSPAGKYRDLTEGLPYYRFVEDIAENFEAKSGEVIANLKKTADLIFNKNNLIVAVTCPDNDYQVFKEKFPGLLPYLGNKSPKPVTYTFEFKDKNEGLQAPSPVQYVAKGYNYKALGYTYSGKFVVLRKVVERDYLQRKIRILGGAYGKRAFFPRDGFVYFGSYRDPNLVKTLDAYDKTADYLKNFNADEREMTRFILGAISIKDRLLKPHEKGIQAVSNYLQNLTYEELQNERDEILSTTREDIRKMAKMVADIMGKNTFCVFGNEKKLEEHKNLFDKLINISQ